MDEQVKFDLDKIKLIVGLGNIGAEYDRTRHNAGFDFLDFFASTSRFNQEPKLKSHLFSKEFQGKKILLCKPTTFMNTSGEAVVLVSNYYEIKPEEILIAHDDLDLTLGNFKIQFAKGPKIHNGILSIENRLGTNKFWRLRIGVDNRDIATRDLVQGSNYVLGRFKISEQELLNKVFEDIVFSL